MTATFPPAPARLGFVLDEYRSIASPEAYSRLRRFISYCGASSTLESVQAYKIEEFLKQQVATSTPPRSFMDALKKYFAYAREHGHIEVDPMRNVRLPRATGIAATAARRAAAATSANAVPIPVARTFEVEYVTRVRQQDMIEELDRLKVDERRRISGLLEEAIKDGDLSENAGYDDAKMRQGMLEARIRELEDKLRRVALIEDQEIDDFVVGVGTRVTLRDLDDDADGDIVYTVVGPEETDPSQSRISHRSPVGKALLGKRKDDVAEVQTPAGNSRYLVIAVARGA